MGIRQVKGLQGRYNVGKRCARQVLDRYKGARRVQGRHKGCNLGMRQVKGVQGSHKASTRDAEMVQKSVKGTVW